MTTLTAWLPEPQLLQLPQPLPSWLPPQQPWPEPLQLLPQLQPPQSGEALQLLQPRRQTGSQTCAEPPPLALQVAALPAPAEPIDTLQSQSTLDQPRVHVRVSQLPKAARLHQESLQMLSNGVSYASHSFGWAGCWLVH